MGKFLIFCRIQLKFCSWLYKKCYHTSWKFQFEKTSNKKVITKKPLTNLYEMNSIINYLSILKIPHHTITLYCGWLPWNWHRLTLISSFKVNIGRRNLKAGDPIVFRIWLVNKLTSWFLILTNQNWRNNCNIKPDLPESASLTV